MKVYRYEHPGNGYGPYTCMAVDPVKDEDCAIHEKMLEEHNDDRDTHPGMRSLSYKLSSWEVDISHYRSAMNSPEALRKWFWKYNGMLRRSGYKVVEYTVPAKHVIGPDETGQVAFPISRFSQKKAVV